MQVNRLQLGTVMSLLELIFAGSFPVWWLPVCWLLLQFFAFCRAEAEAETQRRLQAAARVALRREQKAASLPPEPAPGSSGIATIRVRLPDGLNKQRRFEPSSTVQVMMISRLQWLVFRQPVQMSACRLVCICLPEVACWQLTEWHM